LTIEGLAVALCMILVARTPHWGNLDTGDWPQAILVSGVSTFSIAIMISVTRFAAQVAVNRLGNGIIRNAVTFLTLGAFQFVLISISMGTHPSSYLIKYYHTDDWSWLIFIPVLYIAILAYKSVIFLTLPILIWEPKIWHD